MRRSLGHFGRPLAILWVTLLWVVAPVGAQDATGTEDPPGEGLTVHVVQRGETLFRIAQNHGTTVEALQAANNILDPTQIAVGQRLVIPERVGASAVLPGVTLQPEDTLTSLALRLGASARHIAELNNITNPDRLFVGQRLDVAADPAGAGPITEGRVHHVQEGETLSRIAVANGSSPAALLRANRLSGPSQLYAGQRLVLPQGNEPLNALESPWISATIHPLPAEQGRTISLTIRTSESGTLQGRFLSRDLRFISEGSTHVSAIGIHAFTRPGVYSLDLTFTDTAGQVFTLTRGVFVDDGGYEDETINVPSDLEALLDEPLLDQEYALVSGIMSNFTPQRYWNGLYRLPTGGDVASAFGTRRVYSGAGAELTGRFHSGADFAMPVGTPIIAPADGVVAYVGALEVRGNVTIIDHGWGVFTGYWHQAGILVGPGETVRAGQEIGNIGNTGLTTGAHLHWEMWVSGVQVDPLQWVRETMP